MAELHRLLEDGGSYPVLIDASNNGSRVHLVSPNDLLGDLGEIEFLYNWRLVFKLEGLRATINIESLPVAPFPEIFPEDSTAKRNNKILQTEYHNDRFMLRLYKQSRGRLFELGEIPLQNKGMQTQKTLVKPFLTDGNVKLLNKDDALLAEIIDAGYGLFSPNDWVQMELDYSWYISGFRRELIRVMPNNFGKTINPGSPQLLLPANPYRARLNLINNGESDVSIAFGKKEECIIGQCLSLKPGLSWNDEFRYGLLNTAIWAVAHNEPCLMTGVEGTYI